MFQECIKMAIDGMITNKLRTFLTMLGIVIGVGAVIAIIDMGDEDAEEPGADKPEKPAEKKAALLFTCPAHCRVRGLAF